MSVVDDLPFDDVKKEYILKVLDPILESMVADVLKDMPKAPVDFMIEWLRKRSSKQGAQPASVKQKNSELKKTLRSMTQSLAEAATATKQDAQEEEEEEDDDCDCDDIPEDFKMSEKSACKARTSVSAEVYGQWNKKKAFTAPIHQKTDDQKARLKKTLLQSFMFLDLDSNDMETIIMAMKECKIAPGQKVITEGENGDYLFVIEAGSLDCMKEGKVVKNVGAGEVFGELALLYNCPRAASVVAKDPCVCWQLDRETFNYIVKEAAAKRRNLYDNFLGSVPLIAHIGAYERSQIADALRPESFKKGDVVVKQGDPGDKFYILEEGRLYAQKNKAGEGDMKVMEYKSGDYFGELALLKNQPRAASVIVESDTAKVLSMSRFAFTKMLGPLQELLARGEMSYK